MEWRYLLRLNCDAIPNLMLTQGCGELKKDEIYFPLASPGLAILAVLTFNAKWNDYFTPLIFMKTKDRFPITLGIVDLQGYMATGSISVVLAGIVLSTIPVIIIYIFGQRYLVEGLMMGGLKG